ncbi:copper-binding protein [Variovorax rhizosphaerae]|uniref:Copper-binding protein n=1 Tax=Variovorax rhizosphaerae TaxID=1836200 RepID=A0ABU8WRR1_9BURK
MKPLHVLAIPLLAASLVAQAQSKQPNMPMPMKEPAQSQNTSNALTDAVVQRIEAAAGEVVLKHGDIPNLAMPPMTMAFDADKKTLSGLKVGDKVRFHAEIVDGRPKLTRVEHVR